MDSQFIFTVMQYLKYLEHFFLNVLNVMFVAFVIFGSRYLCYPSNCA